MLPCRRVLHLLLPVLLAGGCLPTPAASPPPSEAVLLYVEQGSDGSTRIRTEGAELPPFPLEAPESCSVYSLHPAPLSGWIAIEYECAASPQVVLVLGGSGDSENWLRENTRFLAWSGDGREAYLKTDPFGSPAILRFDPASGADRPTGLPPNTYDLATLPDGHILYSVTSGLGFGSASWLAQPDGSAAVQVLDLPASIAAYLEPSPDGSQVAFIKFPDSQLPFPDGELWLMDVDGSQARLLASADAGHGYAPSWSPDGTRIAFVRRENPTDPQVGQSMEALRSDLYLLEPASGSLSPITTFEAAVVESAVWSPDGTALAFNVVRDGTIRVWFSEAGELRPLGEGLTCCAVWLPGR